MRWSYEVDPPRIAGEGGADDYDAASAATIQDALAKADAAVIAGTWTMRPELADDVQDVGGDE